MGNLTLAVTTIGDLLLKNKITKKMDDQPIENVGLIIPEYQRPYKWSARNAIQLLDDVIEARNHNKEVYRVGTLILHQDTDQEGHTQYNIVDGQQRTITFALLLYALYENRGGANMNILNQEVFDNQYSRHNIPNNLNAFRRRLHKHTEDVKRNEADIERLREYIEQQCELVVVITEDLSEAFQFFDSQNARGKALYPHDLLKAYHLREMSDVEERQVERIVKDWEKIPQSELAGFFGEYLYPLKEWIKGNRAIRLDDHNIYKFKGITKSAHTPYAQFYKSAFSYAQFVNTSAMPFVAGIRDVNAFQLNTPIIAGEPFFDYTKHYYEILKDIRDNSKYEGFYVQDNIIVKTLDKYYVKGSGNKISRLLFDTALLLYVDRFCPVTYPSPVDVELFEQYLIYAFIWAYSLRAQYRHLGWLSAQNYILESGEHRLVNSLNMYKLISDSDTPVSLLSTLADKLNPLDPADIKSGTLNYLKDRPLDTKYNDVYVNFLHFFKINTFYID